jgi:hypothetical protein
VQLQWLDGLLRAKRPLLAGSGHSQVDQRARLIDARGHSPHVPRSPRHRVARREGKDLQAFALGLASLCPRPLQLHHAGQDFGRLTDPALRIGGADWQNAPTHKDRTLPDRLTTTASAQTRESSEIDLPIASIAPMLCRLRPRAQAIQRDLPPSRRVHPPHLLSNRGESK